MLDIKAIRSDFVGVKDALARRGLDESLLQTMLELDRRRSECVQRVEKLRAERKEKSAQIGKYMKGGQEPPPELSQAVEEISAKLGPAEQELNGAEKEFAEHLLTLPNLPAPDAPDGRDENDNVVVRECGEPTRFSFVPKEHTEIGAALGCLDFARAVKLSGARFAVSCGPLAALERALSTFMIDLHTREHGYLEVMTPALVRSDCLVGTGQLPKFAEDLFKIEDLDLYLIPTAEVTLTNLHREETLPEKMLPLAYTAYTPCFRSEAGSYGKDVKGLIRLHQFNKVELVRIVAPDNSAQELELLLSQASKVLELLGLPYRVVSLCCGDLGFSAVKTYDLEVWLPGQQRYREISSCSLCGDFQARRAGLKMKPAGGGKPYFVHTLNGSGLAVGRTLVAILENYQTEDGSVNIPEVLWPYLGGRKVISPGKALLGK